MDKLQWTSIIIIYLAGGVGGNPSYTLRVRGGGGEVTHHIPERGVTCDGLASGVVVVALNFYQAFFLFVKLTFTSYRNLKSTGSSTAFSTAPAKFTAPLPENPQFT